MYLYFGEAERLYAGEDEEVEAYGEGVRFGNLGLGC